MATSVLCRLLLVITGVLANGIDMHRTHNERRQNAVPKPMPDLVRPFLFDAPIRAARPATGATVDQSHWTAVCDSKQTPNLCINVLDGNQSTYWQSDSSGFPHTITLNMRAQHTISGIAMLPTNNTQGNVATHEVYVSLDGITWGDAVAYGTWWGDATEKTSVFVPVRAQYVRLVSRSAALGEPFLNIADLKVFIMDYYSIPPFDSSMGRWGPTIDFPTVPAGGWIDPISGRVITFSSYEYDRFDDRKDQPAELMGRTLTAIWDPITESVSQRIVDNTGHDMFCPGMSFDLNGRVVITGGRSNYRTSIYDPSVQTWTGATNMTSPRGYQTSVMGADGRIFVIGGSWETIGPPYGCLPKNAEIYDPAADTWTPLPNCLVKPMWTAETSAFGYCPTFRRDNHGWLFAWKNNTVFQAGPSKATNWYTVTGTGGIAAAGPRSNDDDAMCGIAVMYDATQGKILTAGGSFYYANKPATANAFTAALDDFNFNTTVSFSNVAPMAYPRIYHNAIVLPTGDVLVVGGRQVGGIFADGVKSVTIPEIYSPTQNVWTQMANQSTPRNYHSFAILLPDATVISGGGGLCPSNCSVNHFDAQIFTPPYLLTPSGALAVQPVISDLNSTTVQPGASVQITADSAIANASLIRYGAATHTVNTDQRRIPLSIVEVGLNSYVTTIPGEAHIALPGYWMLFVLNSNGVPSKAARIQITLPPTSGNNIASSSTVTTSSSTSSSLTPTSASSSITNSTPSTVTAT